ncbi:MAG: hypothetical protein Q9174_001186 [Haloplaca sp. 1 TL-2023]
MSRTLTVFGATGQQGGSLLRHLLKRLDVLKLYSLRGVTRDVSKPAALQLKDAGVEMVQANMNDEKSLTSAVAGSYAVYAMTDYWQEKSADVEVAQGKAMANAAVAAGAELLIWSSLPNVTEMTGGKITVYKQFDSKAAVETYIRGLPIKSAFFMPGMYMQMMTNVFRPKMNEDGDIVFSVNWSEGTGCPLIDITNIGMFVLPMLMDPDKYKGKNFTAATAYYTPAEMIQVWEKVTGKKIEFAKAGLLNSGPPPEAAKMLKQGEGLIEKYDYYGPTAREDLEWTLKQLDEPPTVWEDFVKANEPWF